MKKSNKLNPLRVGNTVFIRTVTMYQLGTIVALDGDMVVLDPACWVSWTGRFGEALKSGVLSELDVIPGSMAVGRGAIIDVCNWTHPIPTESKS